MNAARERTARREGTAKPAPSALRSAGSTGLVQRKCNCGGTPGADGECTECRRKRSGLQARSADHPNGPSRIQTRLAVGPSNDEFEQEADRAADRVMTMREPGLSGAPLVQRRASGPAEPSAAPPIVDEVLRTPGHPLDVATRARMEPRFGHDFSHVRVHDDARAAESARSISAMAYTVGHDVAFGAGQYAPGTAAGQHLLAHELAHVIQQQGGSPSSAGVVQRATNPVLDKIEDLLSYGLFDWAITDSDAIKALELVKGLSRYEQAVFASNAKYLERLRDNLPKGRLAELTQIEKGIADIRPPSSEIEDIRSDLSYGLFDWVVTDAEAVDALDKLKKLPESQQAAALGSINYNRLYDNLPDNRKQELMDLMEKHMGPGGTRTKEEEAHPGAILSSITFTSEHGVLRNNTSDWSSSGKYYGAPSWSVGKDRKTVSNPISHNKNSNVTASLLLNVLPITAPAAPMTLRGESDEPGLRFQFDGTFQGGMGRRLDLTSTGTLPDKVTTLRNKRIRWSMKWRDWDHEIEQSLHTIYVTMDTPTELEDGAVTTKRLAKAIEIIEPFHTLIPHPIVARIMKNWNVYELKVPLHFPVWSFADDVKAGGQCIDIVRFVLALIKMIGCPGKADPVVVWAHPSAPHAAIEQIWRGPVGLHIVGPHPSHPDWHAGLLDGAYHSNAFEAALKFDDLQGTLAYYGGGADVYGTKQEVLEIFRCLSWIRPTGGLNCEIMEVAASYAGGCEVGAEHECFVRQ